MVSLSTHMGCWKSLLGRCAAAAADGFSQLFHHPRGFACAGDHFANPLAESPSQTHHEAAEWVQNLLPIEQIQALQSSTQHSSSRGHSCWQTPGQCAEPRRQTGRLQRSCSPAASPPAWPPQFPPCAQFHHHQHFTIARDHISSNAYRLTHIFLRIHAGIVMPRPRPAAGRSAAGALPASMSRTSFSRSSLPCTTHTHTQTNYLSQPIAQLKQ